MKKEQIVEVLKKHLYWYKVLNVHIESIATELESLQEDKPSICDNCDKETYCHSFCIDCLKKIVAENQPQPTDEPKMYQCKCDHCNQPFQSSVKGMKICPSCYC